MENLQNFEVHSDLGKTVYNLVNKKGSQEGT